MTVVNVTPRKTQAGPQVAPWSTAIPFEFFLTSEIEVRLVTSAGVESVLTLGVDYTITGGEGNTGTVNALADIAAGDSWLISRKTLKTQVTNYQELDRFPAESHEEGLDRLALLIQELEDLIGRSMLIPAGDDRAISLLLPNKTGRASSYLYFDATGKPTAVTAISLGAVAASAYMTTTFFALTSAAAVRTAITAVEDKGNMLGVRKDTAATRGGVTPGAFGHGVWFESDTGKIFLGNAAAYLEAVIEQATFATLPNTSGKMMHATDRRQVYVGTGAAKAKIRHLPPGYIAGCTITRSGVTQLTFNAGACRNLFATGGGNAADDINIEPSAVIRKDFSAIWTQGDLQGGLPAVPPALGNQWYHAFLLGKSDGTVDAGFDTAVNGSNLLPLANAAGFSWARRVGSFRTNGVPNIVNFFQKDGWFYWVDLAALTLDRADVGDIDYTVAGGVLVGMANAPSGLRSIIDFRFNEAGGGSANTAPNGFTFTTPDLTAVAPAKSAIPYHDAINMNGLADQFAVTRHRVISDASSPPQIRVTAFGDTTMRIEMLTLGWYDWRGQDLV